MLCRTFIAAINIITVRNAVCYVESGEHEIVNCLLGLVIIVFHLQKVSLSDIFVFTCLQLWTLVIIFAVKVRGCVWRSWKRHRQIFSDAPFAPLAGFSALYNR